MAWSDAHNVANKIIAPPYFFLCCKDPTIQCIKPAIQKLRMMISIRVLKYNYTMMKLNSLDKGCCVAVLGESELTLCGRDNQNVEDDI